MNKDLEMLLCGTDQEYQEVLEKLKNAKEKNSN
jgi:hypothetical protein